jgi:transglutaminase-like putative cysteine protease
MKYSLIARHPALALCAALSFQFFSSPLAADSPKDAASRKVNTAPLPRWVETLSPDLETKAPEGSSSDGSFYLLADTQVNVEKESHFNHYAIKILSDAGVQSSSSVDADWDPSFQRLDFHYIRVIRNGVAQNRLKTEGFKVIQRESNLESYMFDGSLSAVLFLEDVRKGDVIEYAYSVTGRNPVFAGAYLDSFGLAYGVPVARLRHRIVHPLARTLNFKAFRSETQPERKAIGAEESIVWDMKDLKAVLVEDGLPDWFTPFAYVQQSEYASWKEVADWALGVFGPRMKAGSGVKKLAWEFKGAAADQDAAILAAIRFVQDQIRYLGIEIGAYSHTPNDPETVLARRYGDCKDKALLLTVILREMGVQAFPALVSTDDGPVLDQWLPSPYAFNHAVVVVDLGGKRIWVDATISSQRGGLSSIAFPDYRRGLVLEPGAAALSEIPRPAPGAFAVQEDFSLASSIAQKDGLTVTTTYSGSEADDMRYRTSSDSRESMAKDYLDYYAGRYPGIASSGAIEIKDDEAADVITLVEHYALELGGRYGERDKAEFHAGDVSSYLRLPDNRERAMPFALHGPIKVAQTVLVHPMSGYDWEKDDAAVDCDAFAFAYSSAYQGECLSLEWKLDLKANEILPDKMAVYYDKADKARDNADYSIDFSSSGGKIGNYPYLVSLVLAALLAAALAYLFATSGGRLPERGALAPEGPIGRRVGSVARRWSPPLALLCQFSAAILLAVDAFQSKAAGLEDFYSLMSGGLSTGDGIFAAFLLGRGVAEAALAGLCACGFFLFMNKRRSAPAVFFLQAALFLPVALIDLAVAFASGRFKLDGLVVACLIGTIALIQACFVLPGLMLGGAAKEYPFPPDYPSGSLTRGDPSRDIPLGERLGSSRLAGIVDAGPSQPEPPKPDEDKKPDSGA